ncbi:MAG: HupE/UreJ family protein [Gammaproteobacteria bacterium]|nr:HupE/UreJ family protein [Gammaproteobacteria bacterium]
MRRSWQVLWLLCCALGTAIASQGAEAHIASNAFLDVEVSGRRVSGSIEIALRDVELAVGIDTRGDGRITWGELRAGEPRLAAYVASRLGLGVRNSPCALRFGPLAVNERVDGNYASLPFVGECTVDARELEIGYRLLGDVDPSHRGLLRLSARGTVQTAVLDPGARAPVVLRLERGSPWRAFAEYFRAGVLHIWSGIDHLLFLLSLLLPAVLLRRGGRWEPVAAARPALLSIVRIVTAFTLAHSITLSLAALDVVRLPARLTESVIAASIVVAAVNNIVPLVTEARARIAFAFGLLHGFGFASVLADMGLPGGARIVSLVAFNLGIEAGQLAVVLAVMPAVYAVRGAEVYRRALLPWGSAAIATLALGWLVQRAFLLG